MSLGCAWQGPLSPGLSPSAVGTTRGSQGMGLQGLGEGWMVFLMEVVKSPWRALGVMEKWMMFLMEIVRCSQGMGLQGMLEGWIFFLWKWWGAHGGLRGNEAPGADGRVDYVPSTAKIPALLFNSGNMEMWLLFSKLVQNPRFIF